MKHCPKLPGRNRDTPTLFRSLVVAAIAYAALTLAIHFLKH